MHGFRRLVPGGLCSRQKRQARSRGDAPCAEIFFHCSNSSGTPADIAASGFPCGGRTSPVRPLSGGLMGSDSSWWTVLAVRVEGRDARRQRGERGQGSQAWALHRRRCERKGCHAATTGTKLARSSVPSRWRFVRRSRVRMIVRRSVMHFHVVVGLHVVVSMTSSRGRADRGGLTRAQHGSRNRTPHGKQDCEQNQDEGAEVLHRNRLSGNGSVLTAQRKIAWLRCRSAASHPGTRCSAGARP